MGDRCDVTLTLKGHLETWAQVQKLMEVLDTHGLGPQWNEPPLLQQLIDAAYPIQAYCEEVNYGNTEDLETDMEAIEGLGWTFDKTAGGGYGPSSSSYFPGLGHYQSSEQLHDGDPALGHYQLRTILAQPNPLTKIREWMQEQDKATGNDLPDITLGDDAKRGVAAMLAKAALQIA